MVVVDNVVLSDDIIEQHFVCDIAACKGACCIEGDSGAPLELDELPLLDQVYEKVKNHLPAPNIASISQNGLYEVDSEGDFCTTTVNGKECVFAVFENQSWQCAIEKAYNKGEIDFQKPISCHLYPIRVTKAGQTELLNYHRWSICSPACECGSNLKIPLYKFLKQPLVRKYGQAWYNKLVDICEQNP